MMNKETLANDPVNSIVLNDDVMEFHNGITKREYFAAMAMQGLITNSLTIEWENDRLSEYAVKVSIALINALNKKI